MPTPGWVHEPVLILGAGFAGLGAARELLNRGVPYLVVERESSAGGLAKTDRIDGFLFDRAGHFIHRGGELFDRVIQESGVEFELLDRRSATLIDDCVVPYPLQFNLWAAPFALREGVERELADLPLAVGHTGDFGKLIQESWGCTLSAAFFRPYAEKLWACRMDELPSEWAARFIPRRDLDLVRRGLNVPVQAYGYNAQFLYPRSGRLGDFAEALAAKHGARMRLSTEVASIDLDARTALFAGGETVAFSVLINTIPLNRFLVACDWPHDTGWFKHANVVNVRVGFRGSVLRDEHWFYVPAKEACFFRVGIPSNVNRRCCPPGHASLSIEIGTGMAEYAAFDAVKIARDALEYLAKRKIIEYQEIRVAEAHTIAPAYVAHRSSANPQLHELASQLADRDVLLAGRFGAWDYLSLEEAYVSGVNTAARAAVRHGAMRST